MKYFTIIVEIVLYLTCSVLLYRIQAHNFLLPALTLLLVLFYFIKVTIQHADTREGKLLKIGRPLLYRFELITTGILSATFIVTGILVQSEVAWQGINIYVFAGISLPLLRTLVLNNYHLMFRDKDLTINNSYINSTRIPWNSIGHAELSADRLYIHGKESASHELDIILRSNTWQKIEEYLISKGVTVNRV